MQNTNIGPILTDIILITISDLYHPMEKTITARDRSRYRTDIKRMSDRYRTDIKMLAGVYIVHGGEKSSPRSVILNLRAVYTKSFECIQDNFISTIKYHARRGVQLLIDKMIK